MSHYDASAGAARAWTTSCPGTREAVPVLAYHRSAGAPSATTTPTDVDGARASERTAHAEVDGETVASASATATATSPLPGARIRPDLPADSAAPATITAIATARLARVAAGK